MIRGTFVSMGNSLADFIMGAGALKKAAGTTKKKPIESTPPVIDMAAEAAKAAAAKKSAPPPPEPKPKPKANPNGSRVHSYNWRNRHGLKSAGTSMDVVSVNL